jgi:flagellar biosynthesis protein FlhB
MKGGINNNMQIPSMLPKNKKGNFNAVSQIFSSAGGFIITVIIVLAMVSLLVGAGILTSGSAEANATSRLSGNLTSGVDSISAKIPTIFTVLAVVLIFFAVLLLWNYYKQMKMGGM